MDIKAFFQSVLAQYQPRPRAKSHRRHGKTHKQLNKQRERNRRRYWVNRTRVAREDGTLICVGGQRLRWQK